MYSYVCRRMHSHVYRCMCVCVCECEPIIELDNIGSQKDKNPTGLH